jgi:hypothetical protein
MPVPRAAPARDLGAYLLDFAGYGLDRLPCLGDTRASFDSARRYGLSLATWRHPSAATSVRLSLPFVSDGEAR